MNFISRVLAIETSCDDTSVAIVSSEGEVEALCSANQDLVHEPFGGIVPEVASRNHMIAILPLVEECFKKSGMSWSDIGGLAVTSRPGLVGSLMVGVVTCKSLAMARGIPFLGVNHIEGHLLAGFLKDKTHTPPKGFDFPFLALAVSGGHTHLFLAEKLGVYKILGQTLDDAAGEAFDKFAKMLGLGYPGGVQVDQLAKTGDKKKYSFPRGMMKEDHLNFSFSGLKTAAHRTLSAMSEDQKRAEKENLCASFQESIVEVLIHKLKKAGTELKIPRLVITGGVSANSRLREKALELSVEGFQVVLPPLRYCTDNAAMVGYVGIQRLNQGERSNLDLGPSPRALAEDYQALNSLRSR